MGRKFLASMFLSCQNGNLFIDLKAILPQRCQKWQFFIELKVARMAVWTYLLWPMEAKVFSIDCCAYSSSVALIVVQNRYRSRIHRMYCFCYLATSLRHNGCLLKLEGHQSTVVWSQAIFEWSFISFGCDCSVYCRDDPLIKALIAMPRRAVSWSACWDCCSWDWNPWTL